MQIADRRNLSSSKRRDLMIHLWKQEIYKGPGCPRQKPEEQGKANGKIRRRKQHLYQLLFALRCIVNARDTPVNVPF